MATQNKRNESAIACDRFKSMIVQKVKNERSLAFYTKPKNKHLETIVPLQNPL